jgi:hypothetical protein
MVKKATSPKGPSLWPPGKKQTPTRNADNFPSLAAPAPAAATEEMSELVTNELDVVLPSIYFDDYVREDTEPGAWKVTKTACCHYHHFC